MTKKISWQFLLIFSILGIRFYLSTIDFNADFFNHYYWARSLVNFGFKGFYERDFSPWAKANYPPLANFFFWLSHKTHLSLGLDINKAKLLAAFYKIPVLVADVFIALLLFKQRMGKRIKNFHFKAALLFLLNIGLIYNSVFWGQLESLVTLFCLFSLISFFQEKKILPFIFFSLALLTKQSCLFFIPIFFVFVLNKTNLKEKLIGFSLMFCILIFSFSFFINDDYFLYPIKFFLNTSGGQKHQYWASANAFNFWFLLGLNKLTDKTIIFGFSLRFLGFFMVSILTLPLLYVFLKKKRKIVDYYKLTARLAFLSFIFLTRMHERHLYSALVFIIPEINSLLSLILYILISSVHFLNLFLVWGEYLAQPSFKTIFFGKILGLIIISIFLYFYLDFFKKKEIKR